MFPTVVMHPEIDLDERAPLRPLGFAHQMNARFLRRAIGLLRVAADARAHDVFPSRRSAAIARDDMVEIQVLPLVHFSAVLTGIAVALENIMPGKLDLF